MEIDKNIYKDIKNLFLKTKNFILSLWDYKFKIFKWALIILALFILYRVYRIITHRKITRSLPVVDKTISIKKTGYYKLGVYLKINEKYFSKRNIIANILFNNNDEKNKNAKNLLLLKSLGSYLYYYYGKININSVKQHRFNKLPYRHLKFTSAISNFKNGDNPFFLFYLNFNNPHQLTRLLYTPINIPKVNILKTHTILAKIRNNGYIKLLNLPGIKKPEIKINKFIYFYTNFQVTGVVHNINAAFVYKYKSKKFLSKTIGLYSGELINVYKVLKNKKNKGNNLKLIKVNISYKVAKHQKGSVKFTSLELIEPNISSLEKIFRKFILKRYFINFTRKSNIFDHELKKLISKEKKNFIHAKTIRKRFIDNTLNQIFIIDYNTKIRHISNIHNKIVRAFYRFIYKRYIHKRNLIHSITNLFYHKEPFYKNLLIPIKSSYVKLKIIPETNTATVQNKKIAYFTVNFKKLKLYKYFTRNRTILNEIMKNGEGNSNKLTLRVSGDDYWHGKYYYKKYPVLNKVKLFFFNYEPSEIKSYFYYNSLPKAYPKFLLPKSISHYFYFAKKPLAYNNALEIINEYETRRAYKFFENLNIFNENYKIVNIKEKQKEKEFARLNKKYFLPVSFYTIFKIIILKIKNINTKSFQYMLVRFYSNKKLKELRKFIRIRAFALNSRDINKRIALPVRLVYFNGSGLSLLISIIHNQGFRNINEVKLKFAPKKLNRIGIYEFNKFHFSIGDHIRFIIFKKSKKTLLDYLNKTPLLELKYPYHSKKLLLLKQFINNEQEFNDLFKNGGGWVYKKLYLKRGIYQINFLNNNFFKINMLTLKRSNAK